MCTPMPHSSSIESLLAPVRNHFSRVGILLLALSDDLGMDTAASGGFLSAFPSGSAHATQRHVGHLRTPTTDGDDP